MRSTLVQYLTSSVAFLCLATPHLCRADDTAANPERVHRVSLGASYTPMSLLERHSAVTETRRDKDPTFALRAGYGYLAARAIEVGGAFTSVFTPYFVLLMPAASLRVFGTVTENPRIEVGATGRIGAMIPSKEMGAGLSLVAGPDVRVWANPWLGFTLGATLGGGGNWSGEPRTNGLTYISFGAVDLSVTIAP